MDGQLLRGHHRDRLEPPYGDTTQPSSSVARRWIANSVSSCAMRLRAARNSAFSLVVVPRRLFALIARELGSPHDGHPNRMTTKDQAAFYGSVTLRCAVKETCQGKDVPFAAGKFTPSRELYHVDTFAIPVPPSPFALDDAQALEFLRRFADTPCEPNYDNDANRYIPTQVFVNFLLEPPDDCRPEAILFRSSFDPRERTERSSSTGTIAWTNPNRCQTYTWCSTPIRRRTIRRRTHSYVKSRMRYRPTTLHAAPPTQSAPRRRKGPVVPRTSVCSTGQVMDASLDPVSSCPGCVLVAAVLTIAASGAYRYRHHDLRNLAVRAFWAIVGWSGSSASPTHAAIWTATPSGSQAIAGQVIHPPAAHHSWSGVCMR